MRRIAYGAGLGAAAVLLVQNALASEPWAALCRAFGGP